MAKKVKVKKIKKALQDKKACKAIKNIIKLICVSGRKSFRKVSILTL